MKSRNHHLLLMSAETVLTVISSVHHITIINCILCIIIMILQTASALPVIWNFYNVIWVYILDKAIQKHFRVSPAPFYNEFY